MSDAKPASTPTDTSVRLCREGTRDNPQSEKVTAPYREIMGSLNYAIIDTRPDIAFAVGLLSRFNQDPRTPHYAAAKRRFELSEGHCRCWTLAGQGTNRKGKSIILLCRFGIRKTARLSTAPDADDQILRRRIRELVEESKMLRRKVLEAKRKEMAVKDRLVRKIRSVFEEVSPSPSPASPTRREVATRTGEWELASGSVEGAPSPSGCGSGQQA